MVKFWIGVVSKEHVDFAIKNNICQVCNGKSSPLKRMKKEDYFLYYSPKLKFQEKEPYQAFTAIGKILDDDVYQVEMFKNFHPYRRQVYWLQNFKECPIDIAREHPEWSKYSSMFRYGHFEVSQDFFVFIYNNMKI